MNNMHVFEIIHGEVIPNRQPYRMKPHEHEFSSGWIIVKEEADSDKGRC